MNDRMSAEPVPPVLVEFLGWTGMLYHYRYNFFFVDLVDVRDMIVHAMARVAMIHSSRMIIIVNVRNRCVH